MTTIDALTEQAQPYIQRICQEFGVTRDALLGDSRCAAVSGPRKMLMAILRSKGWQLNKIGNYVGNRHPTTVVYAIKDVQARMDNNQALQDSYNRVTLGNNAPDE
tara:strand:- start:1980 stop:2294 length:315 start_codon:yes stop_codon:yes gene_type:complete